MPKVSVYNIEGKKVSDIDLKEEIFGIEPNEHVVYLAVKQFLANQRQGTHKAKERSEVAGSTRKLGKQKGGGGARRGDINSPVLVGGGRVFGPRPRDYRFKLNKKMKDLARKSALTFKAQNNQIVVVEDFTFEAPKTKDFVNFTKNIKLEGVKMLLVLADQNKNVFLSARNIESANIISASQVNTYQILDNKAVVLTESSVAVLNELV